MVLTPTSANMDLTYDKLAASRCRYLAEVSVLTTVFSENALDALIDEKLKADEDAHNLAFPELAGKRSLFTVKRTGDPKCFRLLWSTPSTETEDEEEEAVLRVQGIVSKIGIHSAMKYVYQLEAMEMTVDG